MDQEYLIYRTWEVVESSRNMRWVEHLPLLGLVARPWIDMTARDWQTTEFQVRTVTSSKGEDQGVDPTPEVTLQTPNRRVIVAAPQVVFHHSELVPDTEYSQLPLAV